LNLLAVLLTFHCLACLSCLEHRVLCCRLPPSCLIDWSLYLWPCLCLFLLLGHSCSDPCEMHGRKFDQPVMQSFHHWVSSAFGLLATFLIHTLFKHIHRALANNCQSTLDDVFWSRVLLTRNTPWTWPGNVGSQSDRPRWMAGIVAGWMTGLTDLFRPDFLHLGRSILTQVEQHRWCFDFLHYMDGTWEALGGCKILPLCVGNNCRHFLRLKHLNEHNIYMCGHWIRNGICW